MTFGEDTYKKLHANKQEKKNDLKIGFIETNSNKGRPTKPVVIPSAVNKDKAQKLTKKQEVIDTPTPKAIEEKPKTTAFDDILEPEETTPVRNVASNMQVERTIEELEEPVKKRRGRPKKEVEVTAEEEITEVAPKKRGRPRKQPIEEVEQDTILPGFDEIEENSLPGFDEIEENELPGITDTEDTQNRFENRVEPISQNQSFVNTNTYSDRNTQEDNYIQNTHYGENTELTRLLSRDKKVVAFVGTTKARNIFPSK